jgi:antitoxin HicB
MLRYPVKLAQEGKRFLVTVPDVPGVHTIGSNEKQALSRAADALATMLMGIIADREEIPIPSKVKRRSYVELPALTEAKILLYGSMRSAGVGKAEMARRLGWHMPQIDRLLDLRHKSRLDQLEQAFLALGRQLTVEVHEAA